MSLQETRVIRVHILPREGAALSTRVSVVCPFMAANFLLPIRVYMSENTFSTRQPDIGKKTTNTKQVLSTMAVTFLRVVHVTTTLRQYAVCRGVKPLLRFTSIHALGKNRTLTFASLHHFCRRLQLGHRQLERKRQVKMTRVRLPPRGNVYSNKPLGHETPSNSNRSHYKRV